MNISVRITKYYKHLNEDNSKLKHIIEFLWKASRDKAEKCKSHYIFGVSERKIVSAYRIINVNVAKDNSSDLRECYEFDRDNKFDNADVQTFDKWKPTRIGRIRFVTRELSNEEKNKYVGRVVKYWGQNPIHYTD
jgi:hypothetical protein